ncbi:unnamed protein product [Clonostachys rhizophaga]|uniref:Uncharacterized protein n=1 Tax=Clonostachys rhizophaga TaxID=160324 RepID=A0A9N9VU94_9HYPO|nr:unnamed protein product [Clonostachys rhizophaga]
MYRFHGSDSILLPLSAPRTIRFPNTLDLRARPEGQICRASGLERLTGHYRAQRRQDMLALKIMSWTDDITIGRLCWNFFKSFAVCYGYIWYLLLHTTVYAYPFE